MAALPVHYWSLAFVVLSLCCYFIITPTDAISVESMKRESKDNVNGGASLNSFNNAPGNLYGSRRSLSFGIGPKMLQISRAKLPIEFDLLVDNDEGDRSKRFDDYGHMRFGKRGGEEQFDDYGHMRFGRSI